jgi:hypothetical protein
MVFPNFAGTIPVSSFYIAEISRPFVGLFSQFKISKKDVTLPYVDVLLNAKEARNIWQDLDATVWCYLRDA